METLALDDRSAPVFYTRLGVVAEIVLNRPERINAITANMWQRLHSVITLLSEDVQLRCITVKSTCMKAFSPGCDILEFETLRTGNAQGKAYGRMMHDTLTAFQDCPIPLVAEIRGLCVGAGLEIASVCDLRISGHTALFGAPIKNLGLVMAYPELKPLLEIAPKDVVLDMLLTGQIYNAKEALANRLVTRVVNDDELSTTVQETVEEIATGAPLAACWHKQFVRKIASQTPISEADKAQCFACYDTEDYREGCKAFKEKRKPVFARK
jgi:enoyl-CoA hydratase/carnithine racemase